MGDLVRFWYAALFLFASAYTLVNDGHVRVDVLYAGFSNRVKAMVNVYGSLILGLPLSWVTLTRGLWNRSSPFNLALLNFEVTQQGFGMYVKYLMSGFLIVFALAMLFQFASFIIDELNKLEQTDKQTGPASEKGSIDMELYFLLLLFLLMMAALGFGFPVAFALPGSAILSIGLAAVAGLTFFGDAKVFFHQDGPIEWLSAGIMNFRAIYYDFERDTLIAIPLFIFMGIMLQRSRIAEDLLMTMAGLFGPVPGGLGISVVFVGALLATTTGIVGATVVAMGLISLPSMMRNNYSPSLATGTICASGTLGQIIPPSIVLIILADQLGSASDQASAMRQALYKNATGEFTMPSAFDVTSTSAGNMFLGAFLPGIVLVLVYFAYILTTAVIRPKMAPAVPNQMGSHDNSFIRYLCL